MKLISSLSLILFAVLPSHAVCDPFPLSCSLSHIAGIEFSAASRQEWKTHIAGKAA